MIRVKEDENEVEEEQEKALYIDTCYIIWKIHRVIIGFLVR